MFSILLTCWNTNWHSQWIKQKTTKVTILSHPKSAFNTQPGSAITITTPGKWSLYVYMNKRLCDCGSRTLSVWHYLSDLIIMLMKTNRREWIWSMNINMDVGPCIQVQEDCIWINMACQASGIAKMGHSNFPYLQGLLLMIMCNF